jgi:hypothetical protein
MKACFLAAAILMLCVDTSNAQFKYGMKAGLNLSDIVINNYINPDAESDFDIKAGFHGGIFATGDFNEKLGSSIELLYSNKGVKAIGNVNLHYINLPLLVLYRISDKFILELGPEIGYLFAAKSQYGDVSNIWNNKLDIGLDGGAQFVLSKHLRLGLRYNAGFSSVIDISDDSNSTTPGEPIKYQNRVLQAYVSYTLGEKLF